MKFANRLQGNHDFRCADLPTMAKRELSAFFNAVTQLFGSEQAENLTSARSGNILGLRM
jgi:hypothetical protein